MNVGSDGFDAQWECKAELDKAVKCSGISSRSRDFASPFLLVGTISVNCEGYSHPDDPYVLRGSCGLEYTLEYTRKVLSSFLSTLSDTAFIRARASDTRRQTTITFSLSPPVTRSGRPFSGSFSSSSSSTASSAAAFRHVGHHQSVRPPLSHCDTRL